VADVEQDGGGTGVAHGLGISGRHRAYLLLFVCLALN
jgi:hypothetical protein